MQEPDSEAQPKRLTFPQGVYRPGYAPEDQSARYTLTAKGAAALIWCREPLPVDPDDAA